MSVNVNLPAPGSMSQATTIESSRAVAEVLAAVEIALRRPRDLSRVDAEMRRACAEPVLADHAFWSFPRGNNTLTGESIHLARALARCWTNLNYGIKELARNDERGESEMLAFAWDLEANIYVSNSFLVPHKRDREKGITPGLLTSMRDIYENNTNQGARRVRECIFAVLPEAFVAAAAERCRAAIRPTARELGPKTATLVADFGRGGITEQQLETKLDKPRSSWTADDYAELSVLFSSLRRKEISKEEAFPTPRVTTAEIEAASAADEEWQGEEPPPGVGVPRE